MEKDILKKFNLSYSAWSLYKQSQLQFYFQYIEKAEPTNIAIQVYGNAGNVVHSALEDYVDGKETFDYHWKKYKIDEMKGFNGVKLSFDKYKELYLNGCNIIDQYLKENTKLIVEEKFESQIYGINIKGFIDLQVIFEEENIHMFIDWKTNSKNTAEMHKDQRLFYVWYHWKTTGKIALPAWIYLKDYKVHGNLFTEEELIDFDNKIKNFVSEIQAKGFDINNYEIGDWKNPFNTYYNLCAEEVEKRINKNEIKLVIKGHFVFFNSPIHPLLEQGLDFATKFDLKEKHFMQEKAREYNKGIIDIEDIGTIHLYNKKFKCFPIGLLPKILKIIDEYAIYYKKNISVSVEDNRDGNVMNQKLNNFSTQINNIITKDKLRDYQLEAVEKFLEKETGIIQIATGGGKTFTAGELIRTIDGKTLWIIDRKELLEQTKESLEKQLGIEIGIISGRKFDIKDITIATVQSLNSKLTKIQDYLYTVNFVIVDEFHKSAAESYQKVFAKLPNTKYKLGLTATPTRDDGKEPILKSILGEVIYKKTTQDLINSGFLVKPELNFIDLDVKHDKFDEYHEEYDVTITKCNIRNNEILKIINDNPDKKIMILTKNIDHGRYLKDQIPDSVHIEGSLSSKLRTQFYDNFTKSKLKVAIFTISIAAEGLDIPDLDIVINGAANSGVVKSVQILGRVLRKAEGKDKAVYYDFVDKGKWTNKHSKNRMKAFKKEGHEVKVITSK